MIGFAEVAKCCSFDDVTMAAEKIEGRVQGCR